MMGSGGVGGFYGAMLARAGCDVSFIARGAHLAAMRSRGLRIRNDLREDVVLQPVRATDDPSSLGPVDVVIVSVKLWDSAAAAVQMKPMVGRETAVLSLQNGVTKDDVLKQAFGVRAVMGGVAYIGSHIEAPGVVRQVGTMQRIVLGEYDGHVSERAQRLHEALVRSGVSAELSTDVRRALWEKYVFLVGLSGATTSMRSSLGPIRKNPRSRAFMLDLMRETVAIGRAHGVALPQDFAEERQAWGDSLPEDMSSSMHHDLEQGNRLEVEWLAGGVVQLGRAVGVATPMNRAVWDILALHAEGRR